MAEWLEKRQEERAKLCADTVKCSGLVGFLYLELIDASFSLDGVLGAFALSKDILIITIGLFIGAMFVRSLTIMLVEKKTLKQFLYLEHGAHWAIGVLAILMFVSIVCMISFTIIETKEAEQINSEILTTEITTNKNNNTTEEKTTIITTPKKIINKDEYPEAYKIWHYLKKLGYNDYVCAGIMGNIMAECGGQTLNI